MATVTEIPIAIERIRKNWGWFIALGVILVLLGSFAIACPFVAGLAVVSVFGWLLIFSGITQALFSFQMREWGGVALNLLAGVLEIVVGALVVRRPIEAEAFFTLMLIVFLLVGGIFRIVASFTLKVPGAGWLALSGLVSAGLGVWLFITFPTSVEWFLGTVVGVDLIFHGMSWIVLALGLRNATKA